MGSGVREYAMHMSNGAVRGLVNCASIQRSTVWSYRTIGSPAFWVSQPLSLTVFDVHNELIANGPPPAGEVPSLFQIWNVELTIWT